MKNLLSIVVLVAMANGLPSCVGAQKVISDVANVATVVAADVQEAQQWVNFIVDVADLFFRQAQNPDAEKKFRDAEQAVKLALIGVTEAAGAVKSVDDAKYIQAVDEFRIAYESFLAAAKSIGIVGMRNTMSVAKVGAPKQVIEVPELRLLRAKR